jgi:hypothetical protein
MRYTLLNSTEISTLSFWWLALQTYPRSHFPLLTPWPQAEWHTAQHSSPICAGAKVFGFIQAWEPRWCGPASGRGTQVGPWRRGGAVQPGISWDRGLCTTTIVLDSAPRRAGGRVDGGVTVRAVDLRVGGWRWVTSGCSYQAIMPAKLRSRSPLIVIRTVNSSHDSHPWCDLSLTLILWRQLISCYLLVVVFAKSESTAPPCRFVFDLLLCLIKKWIRLVHYYMGRCPCVHLFPLIQKADPIWFLNFHSINIIGRRLTLPLVIVKVELWPL